MTRTLRARIITPAVAAIVLIVALVAPAPASAYPAPKIDLTDLSFYEPPVSTEPYPLSGAKQVENVVLCIGDGMGLNQVALARLRAIGRDGKLHMERLPINGLVRTHSANRLVTDSAAAGTAISSGVKTKNGMIGVAPDGTRYRTILEAAKGRGMATGLVATSAITHATPASFAAHVKSRKMETRIAEQLIANRVNVLLGGGREFFLPKSHPDSSRKDHRDLIAEARDAGYVYVESAAELRSARAPYLLGLFQVEALTTVPPEPPLALLTRKAIGTLRDAELSPSGQRNGFFLMVEGSQIDWAGHDNNTDNCVRQTLLFDQAVKEAVDFALGDGRTLVIVTADHETGGLTISDKGRDESEVKVAWSTGGHTASPVPIYALGPQAERFAGVYDNTEIAKKLAALLGLGSWPQEAQ